VVGVQCHSLTALLPGKTRYILCRRLSGPQSRWGGVRKIFFPPGFDPRTVHSLANRYTVWDIPAQDGENINGHTSRGMRFSCWVTKAWNKHSEYIILLTFPRQQLSSKRASRLCYTYIACLVVMKTGCFIYHVPCEAEERVDDISNMTEHAGLKKIQYISNFLWHGTRFTTCLLPS